MNMNPPKVFVGSNANQSGFSLIEVLIALLLSVIAILVIGEVFATSEARKRTTSGAADAQQSASVSLFDAARTGRLGGAGLTQGDFLWGCTLNVQRSGATLVPAATNYPAPFDTVPANTQVFPAVVFSGQGYVGSTGARGSDVVAFFNGEGSSAQIEFPLLDATAAPNPTLTLKGRNSNGINRSDLLLAYPDYTGGSRDCWVAQVNAKTSGPNFFAPYVPSTTATTPIIIPLDSDATGTYNPTDGLSSLSNIGDRKIVNLGRRPNFVMYGVNTNSQLVQYDLLNLAGSAPLAPLVVAENVVDFRVLIGVSEPRGDPVRWVSSSSGRWSSASLAATPRDADFIVAVRIAMVMRSGETSIENEAPTSYPIFADTSFASTVTLTADQQRFRHQVYDTTVQIRNARFIPTARGT
jgi:type IV pilus assembly protein PilW